MTARKKTVRKRKPAAKKQPDPWWKQGEGLSKAALAIVAAIGMLATGAGFVYRHFTAGEEIVPLKQTVSQLTAILEKQALEAEVKEKAREQLKKDCREGIATYGECVRRSMGPLHPDYGKERK